MGKLSQMVSIVCNKIKEFMIMDSTDSKLEFSKSRFKLASFIKFFFDFGYYVCLSPFRLAKYGDGIGSFSFHIKVWRPQQVLCFILHTMCIVQLISTIRKTIPQNWALASRNPTMYFQIILDCCALFYKSVTLKRFWCNADQYLKIVNFVLRNEGIPIRNKKVRMYSLLYKCLVVFSTLKVFSAVTFGYKFVVPIWRFSPSWWLRRLVVQARYVFWLSSLVSTSEAPRLSEITCLDGALVVVMIPSLFLRFALSEFSDLCIAACSLTLWIPAASFEENIYEILKNEEDDLEKFSGLTITNNPKDVVLHKSSPKIIPQPWATTYRNFQEIQTLSELINNALGSQVTWYMAEGLMYYSSNANFLILTADIFEGIYKSAFFMLTFIILYFSADICKKMESAKAWLTKKNHMKTVPFDEAYIVLHEMITKDIGIRGSNAFTLTFSLVAAYLSLIVTFFIICVQQAEI